ncbi:hypothetical protein DIPPA_07585 [Diplonema papillatum]|nr:hypothetical protein DIPPA_07585 [Diplonema papillatum]
MLHRGMLDSHDDGDESDEEVRWEGDGNAWDDLLAVYRQGLADEAAKTAAGVHRNASETAVGGKYLTLESLSQSTHATQDDRAAATNGATDDFLEFFPEWRTDGISKPIPLTSASAAAGPKRKRGAYEVDPLSLDTVPPTPHYPLSDPIQATRATQRAAARGPSISQFPEGPAGVVDEIVDDDEPMVLRPGFRPQDQPATRHHGFTTAAAEPIEDADEPVERDEIVVDEHPGDNYGAGRSTGAERLPTEMRLKHLRLVQARFEAFASLALERHPDANRLLFKTTRLKQNFVHGPAARRALPDFDPIADDHHGYSNNNNNHQPPPPRDNWLRRIADGELDPQKFITKAAGATRPAPNHVVQQARARFKVEHAPVRYKAGHYSGFLAGVLKNLTQAHALFLRTMQDQSDPNRPSSASDDGQRDSRALKLQYIAAASSSPRCIRTRIVQGRVPVFSYHSTSHATQTATGNHSSSAASSEDGAGSVLHVVLTSHQASVLQFADGDTLVVHPPFHVRNVGGSRRVLLGADIIAPCPPRRRRRGPEQAQPARQLHAAAGASCKTTNGSSNPGLGTKSTSCCGMREHGGSLV